MTRSALLEDFTCLGRRLGSFPPGAELSLRTIPRSSPVPQSYRAASGERGSQARQKYQAGCPIPSNHQQED